MKKKVLLIVIPVVLVVIIATAIIIGIILNNGKDEDESVGTKWGDTYYAYLKEATSEKDLTDAEEKYGMISNMEDAKLQFCEASEGQDPTMIMTYKKNESSYVNVYQITDESKVNYIAYKQPTEIQYLYNIENAKYSWYIHTTESASDSYISLENIAKSLKENSTKSEDSKNVNIAELEADYTIKKEEAEIKQETVDGTFIEYSKFDEIFVKPEIEQNKQIDFDIEIKKEDLKKNISTAVKDYKEGSKKLTDEIKEEVSKKVDEIKTKVEEASKAKEELEKKKAAEEEAKKGIKIGNYTLKYGKYIGSEASEGQILVFNADGTCQYTANWAGSDYQARTFTYKVGSYNFAQDITPHYKDGIGLFNADGTVQSSFYPMSNTELTDGGIQNFKFVGEASTAQSNSSTTSTNNGNSQNNNTSSSTSELTSYEYDTSANNPVTTGTYYRGKDSGTESVLEISNSTGNSFDFKINAIYMTQAGYPNLGEVSGTAKAIKGGNYVYNVTEYGYEYNIFFKLAGGESSPTITIEDECYNHNKKRKETMNPYCGHNVTFEGTYSK